MAIKYTDQYNPLTPYETAKDDALSVRAVRDMANSLNNAKRYALNHKVRSHISIPNLETPLIVGEESDEQILLMFAPVYVTDGFNNLSWILGCQRIGGTGAVRIAVYCQDQQYVGPRKYSLAYASPRVSSKYYDCSSDTHVVTREMDFGLVADAARMAWIFVTSTSLDGSTRAKITTLDIIPSIWEKQG
jgi:hypothetical protein